MFGGSSARAGKSGPEGDLRELIESSNDLLWSVDLQFNILTFNRAFAVLVAGVTGTRAEAGMCAEPLWRERYERALQGGPYRTLHTFSEGSVYELAFWPLGGTGVAVSGRESAAGARYWGGLRASADGVVITDLDGVVREANAAYYEMSGFGEAELRGIKLGELEIGGAFRGRSRYEGRQRTKDGGGNAVEVTIGEHPFDEGLLTVVVRPLARGAEAKFATTFRTTPAITTVVSLDDGGRLLDVNDAFVSRLGYGREEVIGRTGVEVGYWVDPAQLVMMVRELLRTGSIRDLEVEFRRKNGEIGTALLSSERVMIDGVRCAISTTIDITERKQVEETLRRSEGRHRSILETAMDGLLVANGAGEILEVNETLCRMTGYGAEELLRVRLLELHSDGAAGAIGERMREVMARGNVRFQSRRHRKDGSLLELEVSAQYQAADGGRFIVFLRDVTAQNQAAAALRESELKFAAAFDSNPAMEVLFRLDDAENRVMDANGAFAAATGYAREEVIGSAWSELPFWASREDAEAIVAALRRGRPVRNFEYRFVSKAGVEGMGLLSAELFALDGAPCGIATTIDVTEWRRVEEAMGSLATAIEHTEEQVVITDADGAIRYCNPAVEKVTGYVRGELLGQNPRVLKSGKHSGEFYRDLWETLREQGVWRGHLTNRKKDGTLYEEEATISPITNAAGRTTGYVAIKRDVTASLLLESQLQQAQKLESIGRLAGGVAHNFNNLLTVINGYTVFLLNRLAPGDPLRVYAEHIEKAGGQATALTRQLLAFSRKQVVERKAVDLNRAIAETVPMLQRLIGENIRISAERLQARDAILGDAGQIHQIIMNLAVNARDAMPEGGALEISTEHVDVLEPDAVLHGETKPGSYVMLTVSDNGCAFRRRCGRRCSSPFSRRRRRGKGRDWGYRPCTAL